MEACGKRQGLIQALLTTTRVLPGRKLIVTDLVALHPLLQLIASLHHRDDDEHANGDVESITSQYGLHPITSFQAQPIAL